MDSEWIERIRTKHGALPAHLMLTAEAKVRENKSRHSQREGVSGSEPVDDSQRGLRWVAPAQGDDANVFSGCALVLGALLTTHSRTHLARCCPTLRFHHHRPLAPKPTVAEVSGSAWLRPSFTFLC